MDSALNTHMPQCPCITEYSKAIAKAFGVSNEFAQAARNKFKGRISLCESLTKGKAHPAMSGRSPKSFHIRSSINLGGNVAFAIPGLPRPPALEVLDEVIAEGDAYSCTAPTTKFKID
eukprot:951478-Amorphochlora_amoeboformis.AAC.1